MENEKIVVVEKKNWIWKVVAIAAAVAALTVAVIAICRKISKKKKLAALEEYDELELFDELEDEDAEETFEAPAEEVIANAEEL